MAIATRKHLRPAMLAGLALALMSCSGSSSYIGGATFTPTMSYARSAKAPAEVVILFAGDQPARPFVRVGSVDAVRSGWVNQDYLFNAIREAGAQNGLDGFMDVQCASPGIGAMCNGTGFVYR